MHQRCLVLGDCLPSISQAIQQIAEESSIVSEKEEEVLMRLVARYLACRAGSDLRRTNIEHAPDLAEEAHAQFEQSLTEKSCDGTFYTS